MRKASCIARSSGLSHLPAAGSGGAEPRGTDRGAWGWVSECGGSGSLPGRGPPPAPGLAPIGPDSI
eukprot:2050811-Alexandrium_andersonii.AAC.1